MFKLVKSCQKVSSVRKNNKITKKNRPTSKFPESRNAFSEVRSAKLNTDVTILMPGTDYFDETVLKRDITYLSTPCGNHTITQFRCTGSGLYSNLNSQQNRTFFAVR